MRLIVVVVIISFLVQSLLGQKCHYFSKGSFETSNTCSTWNKFNQYCTADSECEAMTEVTTLGSSVAAVVNSQRTSYCGKTTGGLGMLAVFSRCSQVMALNCAPASNKICSSKAELSGTGAERACKPKEPEGLGTANHRYRVLNEDCGNNNTHVCGTNLVCNSQRQCVKAGTSGDACGGKYDGCVDGLICHERKCTLKFSQLIGTKCESDEVCDTGYCNPQTQSCASRHVAKECYRNYECTNRIPNSVCLKTEGNEEDPGLCNHNLFNAERDYHSCMASSCNDPLGGEDYDANCKFDKCESEFVKHMCTQQCYKDPDLRHDLDYEYNFDCESYKATPWSQLPAEARCSIGQQFYNCEAYESYPNDSALNGLNGWMAMAVAMVVIALNM